MRRNPYEPPKKDEKERIVEEFLPIIKHLAYKVSRNCEETSLIDDLISAGIVGLLEAFEKYEPERGIKLNTYAYLRIKGAMIDELRSRDYFSRVARSKNKRIEEAIRILESKLGRPPEDKEVADFLGIKLDDYMKMLKDYKNLHVISIDEITELFGEEKELIMNYVINETNNVEELGEIREIEELMGREIEKLPEKQRLVLTLYYYEDLNMKEIAKVLGITEARVSQLHTQALLNLRLTIERYFK